MEIITILLLALFTFITRVINLTLIPIFTDEAIYIRWAQIGLADPAHRFIALTDGKQPLFTWLMYPMLKIFSDPLFAGRFVSVMTGVVAVLGVYMVGRELFGKKIALISSILYIFSPFTLLYDRLALMDSLLSAIGIWSLYLEILLVTRLRLDVALILGFTVGLGLLTKSSAYFYIYLLPFGLILFDWKRTKLLKRLGKFIALSTIIIAITQVMYNALRLSPWFYLIRQKNYSFIYTVPEIIKSPFSVFLPNLNGLFQFLTAYLTIPLDILLVVALTYFIIRRDKKIILLFLWFVTPFLALALFGKVLFPRFILFMILPLLIISARMIGEVGILFKKNNFILPIIAVLILIYPAYQSFLLVYSPIKAAIPQNDRNQLMDDWPSGYGVKEVVSYLDRESKKGKLVIGTEGTFGLFPAAIEIYLKKNENIDIRGYWPVGEVPQDLLDSARIYPTYLVFKDTQKVPSSWPLELVGKYPRGRGYTNLLFYKVKSVLK